MNSHWTKVEPCIEYPQGYWELSVVSGVDEDGYERFDTYYLDGVKGGGWQLNPENGEPCMYFNLLEEAKATLLVLVRMGAINPE